MSGAARSTARMTTHAPGRATSRVAWAARWLTALAVLVSAVVHLYLWNEGMSSVDVIGPAFLVNGVGGIVIAVAVLVWRHWLPLLAAAGFGAATLGAYVMSRTVGLAGVRETIWTTEAVVSAVVEVLAIMRGAGVGNIGLVAEPEDVQR